MIAGRPRRRASGPRATGSRSATVSKPKRLAALSALGARRRATIGSGEIALAVARALEPHGLFFFEEPLPYTDPWGYAELCRATNTPIAGGGPLLKINANQRYATDAIGSAAWRRWCDDADVTTQEFVSNNTVPCGSTIGPITATRLGIRTVDVGIPILSMHSARELAGVSDLADLARVAEAFFRG